MVICLTKYLLGEKHQLSKIWLAAHWEKKIKRAQIFEVDIERSVQDIMEAEIILDLRVSGHLLVGIVKIHSRKTKYLLTECSSIFYQVKIFHAGRIDLPDNKQTAAVNDITLTEFFNDNFDNAGNDIIDSILTTNQSRVEDITLKETSERLTLLDDDDMVDFVFHEEDEPFDFPGEDMMSICNDVEISKNLISKQNIVIKQKTAVYNQSNHIINITEEETTLNELLSLTDKDEFAFETLNSENVVTEIPEGIDISGLTMNGNTDHAQSDHFDISCVQFNNRTFDKLNLEPLSVSSSNGTKIKKSRKRKLSMDYIKCISQDAIKKQMLDTSDIMSVFDMAPSSKRLMVLKETGCAEKLFCLPVLRCKNPKLLKLYQRNLKTCQSDDFELPPEEEEANGNSHVPRKKSKTESFKECAVNENQPESFDETSMLDSRNNTNLNIENDFPAVDDNFYINGETTDDFLESRYFDNVFPENTLPDKFQISGINDIQSTPISKTSQEKWELALQGRLIQMLQCLKWSFAENCIIQFSHLVQTDRKLWVAQKFLCLLMLKKFQVISLEQSESYGELFISHDMNFESACSKFCNSSDY